MWQKALWVGVGGFLGANARYFLGGWIAGRLGPEFPWSTFVINVSGCFALGVFVTLAGHLAWRPQYQWAVSIGFLGAYTTFSTYEVESLTLLSEGSAMFAAVNLFGSLIAGLVSAWLGVVAGRLVTGGVG